MKVIILIAVPVTTLSDTRVPFAEDLAVALIVLLEAGRATRILAEKVFRVVSGTGVCYRARPFDGLSA